MRGRCPSKAPARCRVSALAIYLAGVTACASPPDAPPDDAKAAGMTPADFRQTAADVFQQMDGGLRLTPDEIKGRNTWLLWTAGNQLFWDRVAREGYGVVDLLKTLDSRQRPFRFAEMGLINEPGFRRATKPDANGLWPDACAPSTTRSKSSGGRQGVRSDHEPAELHRIPQSFVPDILKPLCASREVIVAAGAFNTPQLLMLSGIGPPDILQRHRIDVRVDLPGVGKNLQDRYEVSVVNRLNAAEWQVLTGATFAPRDPQYREWSNGGQGVWS